MEKMSPQSTEKLLFENTTNVFQNIVKLDPFPKNPGWNMPSLTPNLKSDPPWSVVDRENSTRGRGHATGFLHTKNWSNLQWSFPPWEEIVGVPTKSSSMNCFCYQKKNCSTRASWKPKNKMTNDKTQMQFAQFFVWLRHAKSVVTIM